MTSRARRGFTLLEAIVALAIISLVCVGVLAAEGGALRTEATANARVPLAMLASERLVAVDAYEGSLKTLPDSVRAGQFAAPLDSIAWMTTTSRVSRGLWDVRITVSTSDDRYTLSTRRYRRELVAQR